MNDNIKDSIFIHTAKCGGTSMQSIFRKYKIKIDTVTRSWDNCFSCDSKLSSYFKFTFVRNPWDRMVSNYIMFNTWRKYHWWTKQSFKEFLEFSLNVDFKQIRQVDMFEAYKRKYKNDTQKKEIESQHKISIQNHSTPYINPFNRIFDGGENLIVDFVGRFENLQQDFTVVCDKIGIPKQQLPHKLKSKHLHYTEYYDDETRSMVAEAYAKDIDYFGYKFGE